MKVGKNTLNRKIYAFKDFRGVDYVSSPLEVQPYRATDMANLLLRNGMLHKRNGFRQIKKVAGLGVTSKYEQELIKIHRPASGGHAGYFVVQSAQDDYLEEVPRNSMFYVMEYWVGEYSKRFNVISSKYSHSPITASVCIGNDMYIFANGIFKYDGVAHTLEAVTDFYVPTTTINIPFMKYGDTVVDGWRTLETDSYVAYPYMSNESVNMLTNVVRNKLLARPNTFLPEAGDLGVPFFKLDGLIPRIYDGGITTGKTPKLMVSKGVDNELEQYGIFEIKKASDLMIDLDATIGVYDDYCWYNEAAGVALFRDNRTAELKGAQGKYSVLMKINNTTFQKFLSSAREAGFADNEGNTFREFVIEYQNENLGDTQHDIFSCTVATTFGVDGANDRIFLSGGSKGNMVYISENDINLKPDPTYFPADSFLVCGVSGSKVSGFMRVTDGRLAIFKDIKDIADVSVYYTSGYYEDVGTGEEGNTYKQARFTVQAGDIMRRGISARSVVNLDGDNLFVSEEGVYGIQLSSNVASGERYAKERSRTINPKISKLNLSKSNGIVYHDKYYLAVDNGEVYVADARYKYSLKGDQQDTFNYEWFRLTGLYVKEWFVIEDTLYFIDKDGYICEFTDGYADEYMVSTDNSELTVNAKTVTFYKERLDLVKAASYAVDEEGRTWQIQLTEDETAIVIPDDITISAGSALTLWFCVPIPAYWQSAVLSLENPMYRKNMWSLAMTAAAEHGGMINLGYKTRLNAVNNIEVEGANARNDSDFSFIGGEQTSLIAGVENPFGMYTFDVGGYVGINTYRRRVFERDFVHIQLLFTSETVNDCMVSELDIEYAVSKKNIGVG